jgi:hypothetical protein
MVMRFSGGGVGHKSTRTKAVPVPDDLENDTDVDEDWIDREERAGEDSEMDAADAGSDELDGDDYGELEDVGIDEEIDYGYADSEEDGEGDEGNDEIGDFSGLGPEDGEERWEVDILDVEGYAEL